MSSDQNFQFFTRDDSLEWTGCEDFTGGVLSNGPFLFFSFTSNKTRDEHFSKIRSECQNIVLSKNYQIIETPLGR